MSIYYSIAYANEGLYSDSLNFSTFYGVALPPVLLWRHAALRKNFRKTFGMINKSEDEVGMDGRTNEQKRHFQNLAETWTHSGFKQAVQRGR